MKISEKRVSKKKMGEKIVSRDDCESVIKKCMGDSHFEVVNYKVKPFEDKDREYYKSNCIVEISAKVSKNISRFRFFLKKFVTNRTAFDEFLLSLKSSEKEIEFYERFIPAIQRKCSGYDANFVPFYLYGDVNRLMLFEDLLPKFYTVAKKSNPHMLDRFHVCLAINAVAKLHAASLATEDQTQNVLHEELFWTESNSLSKKYIESGVKGAATLLRRFFNEEQHQLLNDLLNKTYAIMSSGCRKYKKVLTHGNLHTKNFLFKYEKSVADCLLLNFGFASYRPPAYDVLSLIFNTSTQMFRQHYFTYLLPYYFDCLRKELAKFQLNVDDFLKFEHFMKSVRYFMPLVKFEAVLHLEDFGAKPGFYKFMQKDDAAYRQYLFVDRSVFLEEVYTKDPIFKELIQEALGELLEVARVPEVTRENCYEILENRLETTVYDLKSYRVTPTEEVGVYNLDLEIIDEEKVSDVKMFKYLIKSGDDDFKVLTKII